MDRSNDPSVSFQTPTHLSPGQAAASVAAHEQEHVVHNSQKAEQEDMVAHSTVTIAYRVCPECGRIYVAGGTTQTTYTPKQQSNDSAGESSGSNINTFA